jgi:hypothetical protein
VAGAPDGRVASSTIFAASPVDGRAVRAVEVQIGADRRAELWDAGYDDTDGDYAYDPGPR